MHRKVEKDVKVQFHFNINSEAAKIPNERILYTGNFILFLQIYQIKKNKIEKSTKERDRKLKQIGGNMKTTNYFIYKLSKSSAVRSFGILK